MNPILKRVVRPLYRVVAGNPLSRAVLRRELRALGGADPFDAHRVATFLEGDAGADYGVTRDQRVELVAQIRRIAGNVTSGTAPIVHTILAEAVLRIPPETPGVVVECGAWKGASAAALSHACALTGRRLIVCDSFEGLPDDGGERHVGLHTGVYGHYEAGMFAGSEEEVRATLARYGRPACCTYIKGYFEDSLRDFDQPVALAFLDVDLASSTRDCLCALWPQLAEGGYVYSDDAGDLDVVKVFFDEPWWQETLGCAAPGFVGSGCGLPIRPSYSAIGYTRKWTHFDPAQWRRVPFLVYRDEDAR